MEGLERKRCLSWVEVEGEGERYKGGWEMRWVMGYRDTGY
jgi:hypothetical protein